MVCVMAGRLILGIDIGATKIRIGLGDAEGNVLVKRVHKTTDAAVDIVGFIINDIKSNFPKELKEILGVGIASIGPLDLRGGVILSPPNAPFKNVKIVDSLRRELNVKVLLINDAVAAVWAEKLYGAGRNFRNLVYVTLSSGIGVGVIVDGNLLIGKDGNAHEAGHIVIDSSGMMRCRCGGYGHWEAYCSGINMPFFIKRIIDEKYKGEVKRSLLYYDYSKGLITPERLYELARQGDELALKLIEDEIGRLNAAGIASVINCYDPEIVLLGGSIALNNKDLVLNPIVKHIDKYITNRRPIIEVTSLGEDVVLKGALAVIANTPPTLMEYHKLTKVHSADL